MLTLKSDIKPTGGPRNPARLAFSPDGAAILVAADNEVQVWPRWLDAPPRAAVSVPATLERLAFNSNGSRVYLYKSGNSQTDVLNVATGKITASGLPTGDPAWFHFTPDGGFVIVCREEGNLVRYDSDPKAKKKLREVWVFARWGDEEQKSQPLGSHYRFGAICAPAGIFVSLEYRFGGSEPFRGLTVRSTADGSVVYHRPLKSGDADKLLSAAGLTLAIHPSGRYMAYPDGPAVRLRTLAAGVKMRATLPKRAAPKKPPKKPKPDPDYHAVAFNPNGTLLAAAGDDGLVTLYDTATWKEVRSFAWKIGKLRAVCFSADGTRAAALSATGNVVVWDMDI